jgi:hypothetical protein
MGALQFDFLLSRGLQETDKVLDLGCGALRGGIRILEFLKKGYSVLISIALYVRPQVSNGGE